MSWVLRINCRLWAVLAVSLALLLSAVACGEDATPTPPIAVVLSAPQQLAEPTEPTLDAAPPIAAPEGAAGAFGFSHYVFEDIGGEVITTLVEGPAGEQVRAPISYQRLKAMHGNGELLDELGMSYDELGELVEQLDTVRDATAKYRDIEVALQEGISRRLRTFPTWGRISFIPSEPWTGCSILRNLKS